MQQNSNYRVKGALFTSDRPGNGPAMKGFIEIDGVKTEFVCWPKISAKGQPYHQISEDRKAHLQQAEQQQFGGQGFVPAAPSRQPYGNRTHTGPVRKYTPPTSGPQGNSCNQGTSYNNDLDDDVPFAPEFR